MVVKFNRRLLAYIIDMLFIISITMIISSLFKDNNNILEAEKQINVLNEEFIKSEIDFNEYFNNYAIYNYTIEKNNIPCLVINIIFVIFYFIILPKCTNGWTLGKYIMKIKIKSNDKKLSIKQLIIRSSIMNGLCYLILSFIALLVLKNQNYFIVLTILGFLQILLVIISGFMVIYRQDSKGLQDLISKSTISMRWKYETINRSRISKKRKS